MACRLFGAKPLTGQTLNYYLPLVAHIYFSDMGALGPSNGLSLCRRQAITWPNIDVLSIELLGTNCSEILIKTHDSFMKMHLKVSSAKWRLFCLGFNMLNNPILTRWNRQADQLTEHNSSCIIIVPNPDPSTQGILRNKSTGILFKSTSISLQVYYLILLAAISKLPWSDYDLLTARERRIFRCWLCDIYII